MSNGLLSKLILIASPVGEKECRPAWAIHLHRSGNLKRKLPAHFRVLLNAGE
jgi:hypothetical protein